MADIFSKIQGATSVAQLADVVLSEDVSQALLRPLVYFAPHAPVDWQQLPLLSLFKEEPQIRALLKPLSDEERHHLLTTLKKTVSEEIQVWKSENVDLAGWIQKNHFEDLSNTVPIDFLINKAAVNFYIDYRYREWTITQFLHFIADERRAVLTKNSLLAYERLKKDLVARLSTLDQKLEEIEARILGEKGLIELANKFPKTASWLTTLIEQYPSTKTLPGDATDSLVFKARIPSIEVIVGKRRATSERNHHRLEFPFDGTPACTCDFPPCPFIATAVRSLALGVLENPPKFLAKMETVFATPSWQLAVDEIAQSLIKASGDLVRIQWVLGRYRMSALSIYPTLMKHENAIPKPLEYGASTRKLIPQLPTEERAPVTLWNSADSLGSSTEFMTTILGLLVGRENVVYEEKGSQRKARIVQASLSIAMKQLDDGTHTFVARSNDRDLEPSAVHEIVQLMRDVKVRQFYATHVTKEECVVELVDVPEPVFQALSRMIERPVKLTQEQLIQSRPMLERMTASTMFQVPDALMGKRIEPDMRPRWVLKMTEGLILRIALRFEPIEGGGRFVAGCGPALVRGTHEGNIASTQRSFNKEIELRNRLVAEAQQTTLSTASAFGEDEWLLYDKTPALECTHWLQEGEAAGHWVTLWETPKPRVRILHKRDAVNFEVKKAGDWFGLEGQAQIDGEKVALAVILESMRRDRSGISLADNQWLLIRGEVEKALQPFAQATYSVKQKAVLRKSAPLELKAETGVKAPREWSQWVERIDKAQKKRFTVPKAFAGILRPYQDEGVKWMLRLAEWGAGAVLADDMGLGKTVQTLSVLEHRKNLGPALVVAPASVCFNWRREAEKFAPSLQVMWLNESDSALRTQNLEKAGPGQLWVVSYGLLPREEEALKAISWSTVVFDEAQNLKNPEALRTKAAAELKADFRLGLTGTPLENSLVDLWSIFEVVFPGFLGPLSEFRSRFESGPAAEAGNRKKALSNLVRPYLLRRRKDDVATELPPKTEIEVSVELSPRERELYDRARVAAAAELSGIELNGGAEKRRFEVLAAITRLRRLACHPALEEKGWKEDSAKMTRILETLETLEKEGHRALVFSQFVGHLQLLREALEARKISYLYLDGQTPVSQRASLVDAFQRGEGSCFLISLKAGGAGLNLTAADYVLHMDPWWNPAVEDQATDRAHRIGQDKPVTVYRFVSSKTIEEEILKLHASKRDMVQAVLEGTDAGAKLSVKALIELMQAGRAA